MPLQQFAPAALTGTLVRENADTPITGAAWYTASTANAALIYEFPAGALVNARWLSVDMLLDGVELVVFTLMLHKREGNRAFRLSYGLLNQCAARIRLPLDAINQNRWGLEREGAWLKPVCSGSRVDLYKVDHITLKIERKGDAPARFCVTPLTASLEEPPKLTQPALPAGKLLDELGQSTLREWSSRTRSAEEMTARLHQQLASASTQQFPPHFSRWGGWKARRVEATGYFRTHHDGRRWWLVDPDGYLFWSAGMDAVRVATETNYGGLEHALTSQPIPGDRYDAVTDHAAKMIRFVGANLIRAFGADWFDAWKTITLTHLRAWGFNTIANFSDWQIASAAGFPYVRSLRWAAQHTPLIYRDFPDVFHPDFERDAADFAAPLRETADDPALIGYYLMNEPRWGFSAEVPAAAMLFTAPECATRRAFADWLRERYHTDDQLARAWKMKISFDAVASGVWSTPLTDAAQPDLIAFSAIMVKRLFDTLGAACRAVDPHHLNLGACYYTTPPAWAAQGMGSFDVFTISCYESRVPEDKLAKLHDLLRLPIMIGEWHFGALDVGLPASGIGRVRDQAARGQAYRFYVENAAAQPWCVGTHYFSLYDQSALGRYDGENFNIGFLDVCNRPYEPLAHAARMAHERVYPVMAGEFAPYADAPVYLPKLFT